MMRDLVLGGAGSFGSYHIARVYCEEYVHYLSVTAARTGSIPVPSLAHVAPALPSDAYPATASSCLPQQQLTFTLL